MRDLTQKSAAAMTGRDKMRYEKFDMHCHTAEGSTDSDISVLEFADRLKKMGFQGMLVTDHNTYGGYLAYQNGPRKLTDFVVLRGIEYDTFDYGHMLVVMPTGTPKEVYRLLTLRGMSLKKLIRLVHCFGGILGPAHPGGEPFLSFAKTKYWNKKAQRSYAGQFDFIEGYNACEDCSSNAVAKCFSNRFWLPMFGGSDAHSMGCAGRGYTLLPWTIQNEDDLIAYYKTRSFPFVGGRRYGKTVKDRLKVWNIYLVVGFFFYNKAMALFRFLQRKRAEKDICQVHHTEMGQKNGDKRIERE